MKQFRTPKQIERHFKGVANHRRIAILLVVSKNNGITLDGLVEQLKANQKTLSEHTRRLVQAGLLDKHYSGRAVEHSLSPYGKRFITFIKTLQ